MHAAWVGFDVFHKKKGKGSMKEDKLQFTVWLRAFGVLLILACHFTRQSGNTYLILSSQFFNIGNSVFFILSGFLFGIKSKSAFQNILPWYKKRLLRIYLPYELMLVVLFIADILIIKQVDLGRWLSQILGVQAWNGVYGATQTWFVTSILLCYLITPIIAKVCNEVGNNRGGVVKLASLLIVLPAILPYVINGIFVDATIIVPVFWYALAFLIGANFEKVVLTKRKAWIAFSLMCVGFLVRVVGRIAFDDTILYNQVIATYTHAFGAFCIFYIFAVLFKKVRPMKLISGFAGISYEIYLWHYMFTDGPLRLFGLTGSWITDCALVLCVSIVVSLGAHWITNRMLIGLK